MVTVKEPLSDFTDLGPVIYQESKILDNEIHLLCVHDNAEKKFVNFEAYSFETAKISRIQWDYINFDSHFRFNAELMNPNNKEGRYHWICERLAFVSDGKGERKLALAEPTDDIPQVADRARNFTIPTGRMNFADRARLRQEMERLPNKRGDSIKELETEFKKNFILDLEDAQEYQRRKVKTRMDRIALEREQRYSDICAQKKAESELVYEYADRERKRGNNLKIKEESRKREDLASVREVLARHDAEARQKQQEVSEARARKQRLREEQNAELEEKINNDIDAENKRMANWEARDDRLEQKSIRLQAARSAAIEAEERANITRSERQQQRACEAAQVRKDLWQVHTERAEQRLQDQNKAIEAVKQKKDAAAQAAMESLQIKEKKKKGRSAAKLEALQGEGQQQGGVTKMDSVEATMRQKLVKEDKQAKLESRRKEEEERKTQLKNDREIKRLDEWKTSEQQADQEKRIWYEQFMETKKEREREERMEKMKERDVRARKERQREANLARKAQERMKKLVPHFKIKPGVEAFIGTAA